MRIAFVPMRTSHNIGTPNYDIRNAVVVIHGFTEDVEMSFCSTMGAIRRHGKLKSILVLAPWCANLKIYELILQKLRFFRRSIQSDDWVVNSEYDLHISSLFWHSNSSWISGGDASQQGEDTYHHFVSFSSYDVLDKIYHFLGGEEGRELFPKLTGVTYVGFSAGGQMINRYSWVSNIITFWLSLNVALDTPGNLHWRYSNRRGDKQQPDCAREWIVAGAIHFV